MAKAIATAKAPNGQNSRPAKSCAKKSQLSQAVSPAPIAAAIVVTVATVVSRRFWCRGSGDVKYSRMSEPSSPSRNPIASNEETDVTSAIDPKSAGLRKCT